MYVISGGKELPEVEEYLYVAISANEERRKGQQANGKSLQKCHLEKMALIKKDF